MYELTFELLKSNCPNFGHNGEYSISIIVVNCILNYRDNPPTEVFEFDGSLLYAPCAPTNVTAGQVVVNNLTHKSLTDKLVLATCDHHKGC